MEIKPQSAEYFYDFRHFESLQDMIAFTKSTPEGANLEAIKQVEASTSDTSRDCPDWYGTKDIAELQQFVEHGWQDGSSRCSEFSRGISAPTVHGIRRRRRRADFGDSVDMQAIYAGKHDTAWTTTRREVSAGGSRFITLLAPIHMNCDRSSSQFFWTGAAALVLADSLEKSGYRVKIIGIYSSEGADANHTNRKHALTVVVKDFTDRVNVNNLASILCLSGFFRFYGFRAMARWKLSELAYGYGRSHDVIPSLEQMRCAGSEIVKVPNSLLSRGNCINWLENTIQKLQPSKAA